MRVIQWHLFRPSYIIAIFLASVPIFLYLRAKYFLRDLHEIRSEEVAVPGIRGDYKLVLFALSYIRYKTKEDERFNQVQVTAREFLGRERQINFFMNLDAQSSDVTVDLLFEKTVLSLAEEPFAILPQMDGLTKLFEFFREIREDGRKLILFNINFKDVDLTLLEKLCSDAHMKGDLVDNVYGAGQWYDIVSNKYRGVYSEEAQEIFVKEVTDLMLEQLKGTLNFGETYLEHSLRVQVPFLERFGITSKDFGKGDLRFFD